MTTSDPRAERRDDNPEEHRGLGKRILDAVLGDPAEQRPDDRGDRADVPATDRPADSPTPSPTDADRPADTRAAGATEGYAGDGPRGEYTSYEQAMRDQRGVGAVPDDRGTTQRHADPREAARDAGYDPSETAAYDRRDTGQAGYTDRPEIGDNPVARAAGGDYRDPGRDPLAGDAPHDLAPAGYEDRRPADREPGYGSVAAAGATGAGVADRGGAGQDFVTRDYDPDRDTGYDPQAAGTAMDAPGGTGADADRDFVTSSYAPDRDTGYDPRAAGTAMDPADGPVARNTNRDADYDPAQDTAYVDAARAEADRTTGRRDDDYDTGRVDADRGGQPGDRVATEPVDRDRSDTNRGANTAAAAGAAAAAAFGSADRDRSDRDAHLGDNRRDDTRFSDVDDTVTVDATGTGRGTPDTGAATGTGDAGVADEDGASGGRERLVPAERAEEYSSRWDALKGDFVDEPRRAVRQADELVGEVLDELQRLFADQRRGLEQSFDHDQASTEDLRLALRRYRSFFDRLLSF